MHKAAKQTLTIALLGLLAFAFAACKNTSSDSGNNPDASVAAVVNGKNIMLAEVDKLINQQYQGQQSKLSPLELAQVRLQVLEQLIQREVLFQRAERENLLPNEEEITQVINTRMQQGQMTQEKFQEYLKGSGQTMESVRELARRDIAIQKLQDRTSSKITISDKEVEDAYNNNRDQVVNKRGVELAAIIVDPTDNGMQDDAKNDLEAKQKIDLIFQQLKSNAEFADVARAKSEDPKSNESGGDIGFATEAELKQNNFPATLVAEFFDKMDAGSYTAPVTFNNRWYIFKLKRKQLQDENLNLESPGVRQKITDMLVNQRKQILNQALLEASMNDTKIVNNLAIKMLESPNNLSGPRPAQQQQQPQPAQQPSPASTPAASPAA
ncbi:MAG: SurA N-terminal domain-containing protein, partial [Pyrinomonadaceae bacterium]|nr:SurA N-terminal domain-containing protein [Pyrinomonadaceae bacterium]